MDIKKAEPPAQDADQGKGAEKRPGRRAITKKESRAAEASAVSYRRSVSGQLPEERRRKEERRRNDSNTGGSS